MGLRRYGTGTVSFDACFDLNHICVRGVHAIIHLFEEGTALKKAGLRIHICMDPQWYEFHRIQLLS
jgi:hypothetical protein